VRYRASRRPSIKVFPAEFSEQPPEPEREMLVVEATTDVPDDDKLMKLVSRMARARDELTRALGTSAPTVTALMVGPLPPEELRPIRAKAKPNPGRPRLTAIGLALLTRPRERECRSWP